MNSKNFKLLLIGVITFLGIAYTSSVFADNIGYLDMQRIFLGYKEAKVAQEEFQKKQTAYQEELEKRQEKIDKAREKHKSKKEIKKLIKELEKELEPKKEELLKLNQELTLKLRSKILAIAKQVAKEYGIDVILDRQVVYVGGFDLSEFVIEKLNK